MFTHSALSFIEASKLAEQTKFGGTSNPYSQKHQALGLYKDKSTKWFVFVF